MIFVLITPVKLVIIVYQWSYLVFLVVYTCTKLFRTFDSFNFIHFSFKVSDGNIYFVVIDYNLIFVIIILYL